MAKELWYDNSIQFPRLIAEICATQENLDLEVLADEMDLTIDEVKELFNRATVEFEKIKSSI